MKSLHILLTNKRTKLKHPNWKSSNQRKATRIKKKNKSRTRNVFAIGIERERERHTIKVELEQAIDGLSYCNQDISID